MMGFFLHIKWFHSIKINIKISKWDQKNYFLKIVNLHFYNNLFKKNTYHKSHCGSHYRTFPVHKFCPKIFSKILEKQINTIRQISFSNRNNVKIEWYVLKSLKSLLSKKVSPNKTISSLFCLMNKCAWAQFNLSKVSLIQ